MAEVSVHKNLELNTEKTYTDENGVEQFGVWEMGYRDPETHRIRFDDGGEADAPVAAEAPAEEPELVTVTKDPEVHPSAADTAADENNVEAAADDNQDD